MPLANNNNNNNNVVASSGQEYELKLGVVHDPSLKTVQLIEFLEN